MDIVLIIPIFNRPIYLQKCFESLKKAVFPSNFCIFLIDDYSTDTETIKLYNEFAIPSIPILRYSNATNRGIKENLKFGCEIAFSLGCSTIINLDSDAIVKHDFIKVLLNLQKEFPDCISTGFNCKTKNANGSERHPIMHEYDHYCTKKLVGGINMCFGRDAYDKYIAPALAMSGNWDAESCKRSMATNHPIVCAVPSVVQHIGLKSSMGHNHDMPDIACDFNSLQLPEVTLFGIDHKNAKMLIRASEISTRDIEFGEVVIITDNIVDSRESYSHFCIKRMNEYIHTSHILIIHPDGYVLNWEAWDNDWLAYDYIGATWGYKDNMNVGNGGFSLRSKKLLEILANDDAINDFHPEDDKICRKYRSYLEDKYGIKFAPDEIANKFSIEAYNTGFAGANKYNGQFGFHGLHVDFTGSDLPKELLYIPMPVAPVKQSISRYTTPQFRR